MKRLALFAATLCVTQLSVAQDNRPVACLTSAEMSRLFQAGDTSRLPNYSESTGARVQRQHPNTFLVAQSKYINWNNKPAAICQYSNHVGIVSNFLLGGVTADATDGACDDGSCTNGSYWRSEWTETFEKDDKPGREQIYVCVKDIEGAAIPSGDCRFNRPS